MIDILVEIYYIYIKDIYILIGDIHGERVKCGLRGGYRLD